MNSHTTTPRAVHPWIGAGQERVRFGVQLSTPRWAEFLGQVEEVEALGFDSLWLVDHPLTASRDCWVGLAAAAQRTSHLRLGSLTSCVYYRSPVLLARMAADVDALSNGRLVLGLGIGDDVAEFARMALPLPRAAQRQQALAETVEAVRGLWGTEPYTVTGEHVRLDGARLQSPPQGRVPLLICGGGERVTLRQVARYADMANFGPHEWVGSAITLGDVERKFAALRRHCEEVNRPYDAILRSHYEFVLLAPSHTALQAKLDLIPPAAREFWGTILFAGTPEEALRHYQALIAAGMQYFVATVPMGGDPETLRLLGERVLPEFRTVSPHVPVGSV
jgi:alkanesulfonate monooxygenase SsuD/methylene tetrahydromethanopterin reductase-like flavin-dependent oxidoreductase (luciferase family)